MEFSLDRNRVSQYEKSGVWPVWGSQIVTDSAVKSARLIKGAKEIYYPAAPHGLTATHQDQVNADLLAFLRS
jgi:pimeloyl-ACP methyl ester carboxylesterase